jgi:thiamine-phosphate pyrophosphorylase
MHHYSHTKYYFIDKFDTKIIGKIDSNTILIFRNYKPKNSNETLLLKIKKYCNQRRVKFYLSNNIKLAIKLGLDGAYIPSFNHSFEHLNYSFKRNFSIIGSAHNLKQIKIKEIQKVQKIFLSSLFKKNKNYLGINKFKLLSKLTTKKIVALGGISKTNSKKLRLLNTSDFAGISYFE